MKLEKKDLGTFEQASDSMAVSDPCYDSETPADIRGVVHGVLPGTWRAFTMSGRFGGWGDRVSELVCVHSSVSEEAPFDSVWMRAEGFEVGVDSGQAGIFDHSKYPFNDIGEYRDESSFYGKACKITLSENSGIIDNFGAVSSSGIGDGAYECYLLHNENDKVVGVKIIFLDSDEENEIEEL